MALERTTLLKLHLVLAALVLPVAVMFAVTGALYTWGVKGDYATSKHPLTLPAPAPTDKDALVSMATAALAERDLAPPTGTPAVKETPKGALLEWTGSQRDITLEPGEQPDQMLLTVKETDTHRQFVQLHKAKGGIAFKVYAAFFALSLVLVLASGVLMAVQMPKYRVLLLGSAGAGLVLFVAMVLVS